jgi:hypothetical protein
MFFEFDPPIYHECFYSSFPEPMFQGRIDKNFSLDCGIQNIFYPGWCSSFFFYSFRHTGMFRYFIIWFSIKARLFQIIKTFINGFVAPGLLIFLYDTDVFNARWRIWTSFLVDHGWSIGTKRPAWRIMDLSLSILWIWSPDLSNESGVFVFIINNACFNSW